MNIDLVAKYVAVFGSLLSAFVLIGDYLETRDREARLTYLQLKQETYELLVEKSVQMAAQHPLDINREDSLEFENLFWGKSALIESYEVEKALVTFHRLLSDPETDCGDLRYALAVVAVRAREDLARSWGVSDWSRPKGWGEYSDGRFEYAQKEVSCGGT